MNRYFQRGPRSIMETLLVVLLWLSLLYSLYEVLKVFFGVLTFALIFSVSFASPFERLAAALRNRRRLAACIYSIVLMGLLALPLIYIISTLRGHIKDSISWLNDMRANGLPPLPAWIANVPFAGEDISTFWRQLQQNPKGTLAQHEEVKTALRHILTSGAGVLGTALQLIAGIIISAFFLVAGEKMLRPVKLTIQHLLGKREGLSLLRATTLAIKGVSIGVMGTALIAAVLSWIGLTLAGTGLTLVLSALVFFFVLIQLGPLPVWVPVVIWSASQGHTGSTVFLIIYGGGLLLIDAFLKPILIGRSGGRLPFLVLFVGVIGGLAAWGFTGVFKGAIILAVFYTIFTSWLEEKKARTARDAASKRIP